MSAEAPAQLPAEACYWARLAPGQASRDQRSNLFRSEAVLPVPIESLQTAQARCPDGSVVVVGIEPERLRAFLAAHGDTPRWSLIPATSPGHIAASAATLARLNLLTGTFQPIAVRRWRRGINGVVALGCAALCAALVTGGERRANRLHADTDVITRQADQQLAEMLPPDPESPLSPDARLTIALRLAEQPTAATAPSAALVADAVLGALPRDGVLQMVSLDIAGTQAQLTLRTPDIALATRLAGHLARVMVGDTAWRGEPRIRQEQDAAEAVVVFSPAGAAP